jgi:hypothetical protein
MALLGSSAAMKYQFILPAIVDFMHANVVTSKALGMLAK